MFKFRQLDDLFHVLKTVKGLLHLVPPRTPRISGYGVFDIHLLYIDAYAHKYIGYDIANWWGSQGWVRGVRGLEIRMLTLDMKTFLYTEVFTPRSINCTVRSDVRLFVSLNKGRVEVH
jgi:hypothetical protein